MAPEEGDRHSKAGEDPETARAPEEIAAAEARNQLRQFDRLRELIAEATSSDVQKSQRPFRLRPSTIMELNHLAMKDLHPRPGAYRTIPIEIGGATHQPPRHEDVPALVEDLCDYVDEHRDQPPIHLAAYVMWRLNWIHPFYDGNGRTTRAVSYLMLCDRLGYGIPGTITIPTIIAREKHAYYDALQQADSAHWKGATDVAAMEALLDSALSLQLESVQRQARHPSDQSKQEIRTTERELRLNLAKPRLSRRESFWRRQPRWRRVASALFAIALTLVAAGWQLLTQWDNEQVKKLREWVLGSR